MELTKCILVPYTSVSAPKCPQSAVVYLGFAQGSRAQEIFGQWSKVMLREATIDLAEGMKDFLRCNMHSPTFYAPFVKIFYFWKVCPVKQSKYF